jgi:hypothetical protein
MQTPPPRVPGDELPVPAVPARGGPSWLRPLPDTTAMPGDLARPDVVAGPGHGVGSLLPVRVALPAAGPAYDDEAGGAGGPGRPPDWGRPREPGWEAGGALDPGGAGGTGPGGERDPGGGRLASEPGGRPGQPRQDGERPERPGGRPGRASRDDGWPERFAQALAESLAGARTARQMTPWTTEQARRRIRRLGAEMQAAHRPVVRRVLTSEPCHDVVEMTVIVGIGPRTRAIAARLERVGPGPGRPGGERRWVCTAVEAA